MVQIKEDEQSILCQIQCNVDEQEEKEGQKDAPLASDVSNVQSQIMEGMMRSGIISQNL